MSNNNLHCFLSISSLSKKRKNIQLDYYKTYTINVKQINK